MLQTLQEITTILSAQELEMAAAHPAQTQGLIVVQMVMGVVGLVLVTTQTQDPEEPRAVGLVVFVEIVVLAAMSGAPGKEALAVAVLAVHLLR